MVSFGQKGNILYLANSKSITCYIDQQRVMTFVKHLQNKSYGNRIEEI